MNSLVEGVRQIQANLNNSAAKFESEQATKQYLIVPFIEALGYDMRKIGEVTPEADVSLGVKRDKRVDYKIAVNGQDVLIIECKQRNVVLSPRAIDQLFDYFIGSDAEIGILTNGNDYWFFTDTQKVNRMDKEPYLKLKVSDLVTDEDIIDTLEKYCKTNICSLDVKSDVKEQIFINECTDIARGIITNNIPEYIVKTVADKVGVISESEINKYKMADILCSIVKKQFEVYLDDERSIKKQRSFQSNSEMIIEVVEDKVEVANQDKKYVKDKNKASNIKLNHEYVFNDYTDGKWEYHKLGYVKVGDDIITTTSMIEAYKEAIKFAIENSEELIDKIIVKDGAFRRHTSNDSKDSRWKELDGYDLDINTKIGASSIVNNLEFVYVEAFLPYDIVKFSFKE